MGMMLSVSQRDVSRAIACTLASVLLAGCTTGASSGASGAGEESTEASRFREEITVFAASSMCEAFREIGSQVEASDGIRVNLSCDGSPSLVAQIAAGAPADVLATADERTMDTALEQSLVGDPSTVAANTVVLIVPTGNPGGITGFDHSLDAATVVICDTQVPCGVAAESVAAQRGLTLSPASREHSVAGVRSKVQLGQADAGVVYATDALLVGDDAEVIERVPATEMAVSYPMAVVSGTRHRQGAETFIAAVKGDGGREILSRRGFTPATEVRP